MRIARRTFAALAIALGCIGVTVRGADGDLAALQERVGRLEALTERVEALSAIKRLQHAYGHYSELGLWHDFADLFADSGIGYYTQGALDREGIRSLFVKEVGGGRVGLVDGRIYPHISMQPLVTLSPDGQSARGRWHIMAMLGGFNTSASWAGGVYENQYIRENGVWKMKEVRYVAQYSGRYDNPGWTPTKEKAPFDINTSRAGNPIVDPAKAQVRLKPDTTQVRLKADTTPTLAALAKRMADVAARAERLNDEIEVTNLQHAWGYYVDRREWDEAAALFASDGTLEVGLQGVYVGKASVRRGLTAARPAGTGGKDINDHVHLQTIVSISPDGRTARARGTDLGLIGTGGQAFLTQSIYENEFVKQGSGWKFKAMHIYPRFIVDAGKGWAKDAQPAPGPSRELPPDRPSTEAYEVFPRFHLAPLHFDHPVTGKAPQYPEGMKVPARPREAAREVPRAPTSMSALERLVASTERSVQRSKGYHAAENLTSAYGYFADDREWRADAVFLHQIVQPVIEVSDNGRTAAITSRLFQLASPAGGEGTFSSGVYETTVADEGGAWKLSSAGWKLAIRWTAPSRGGWRR